MMFSGIIFLFIVILLKSSRSHHCDTFLSKFQSHKTNGCYIECKSYGCYMDINVTYNVDFDSGLLVANFTLPSLKCCYHRYDIELLVNEEIKNESYCSRNTDFKEKHSVKKYKMEKCENGYSLDTKFDQYGVVVFNNIYTSCYTLRFKPYKNSQSYGYLYSNEVYIETNFTKKLMPNISHVPYYKEKQLHIKFLFGTNISQIKIELSFCSNQTLVNGRPLSVKADVNHENSICVPTRVWDSKKCAYVFEGVNCTFYNMTPGNYCIYIVPEDDRCLEGTIWTKSHKCRWTKTIEYNPKSENSFITLSPPEINIISTIGIVGTSILLIILVVCICKRGRVNRTLKQGDHPDEVMWLTDPKIKILLLYPRDCKEFMKVMDACGKFLSHFNNVEVFDCYNDEVIMNGPLTWLLNLMNHPRLCTIVVNSQCACIQQNALKSGIATAGGSYYKEPSFMDSIFLYGLKLIMEDISPEIYQKNYVIGFDGFSENNPTLTLPTSFRRYILPNHLKKLLLDMNIDNCDENFSLNSSEYITLQDNIRSLAEYKSKNPHYLENVLNLI